MQAATLLRLYPRDWRRRYGGEMAALLDDQPLTLRAATDLLAGAIDARFNSQWARANAPADAKGATMSTRILRCTSTGVTRADEWRSAAWMIGGSLVMVLVSTAVQAVWGKNSFSESLLYAAFPAALMLSNESLYFKPYSRAARLTLSIGGALFIILMMWGAVAIGNRI
jgi:hypothetical protein